VTDRFLGDDFLLSSETAAELFHDVVAPLPIVDLHNHLSASDIAANRVFTDLTDLWLEDDHYKWRAMRLAGIEERLVTGDADPWERFSAWATTVPRLIRNPLYTWTHLELRRVFGIDLALGPATAREIWDEANRRLPELPARTLLARFGVAALATTDDPVDDLAAHRALRDETSSPVVIPTYRPDAAHGLLREPAAWNAWADRLCETSGTAVADLESLLSALGSCDDRFAALGGRASDHGLSQLPDMPQDPESADAAIRAVRRGEPVSPHARNAVLLEVVMHAARRACERDGVLQLHLGACRDLSPRILADVGRDAGADAIGDGLQAAGLVRFLRGLERDRALPRLVLHNANPRDNALFASIAGAFSRPGVASLVQWGPPWWFNDHEDGMRRQLDDLSSIGQLAGFVGHELFRRVLCDALGGDVEAGRIPDDPALLARVVEDVCVRNAVRFFGLADSVLPSA
jgi:glucuronate isomerase